MKAREMWADRGWDTAHSTYMRPKPMHTSVRVLVQEVPEGRPDFEVGDRVRIDRLNEDGVVMGAPFHYDDIWWVPVAGNVTRCIGADGLTKIPEKTVTITVPRVVEGSKIAREIEETVEGWRDFYGISIDVLERVEATR